MLGRLRTWCMRYRLSETDQKVVTVFLLLLVLATTFLAVKDATFFGDEGYHLAQIEYFLLGKYEMTDALTTIPGYHALMALAGGIMGEQSVTFYRIVNLLLSMVSVFVFLLTAQAIHKKTSLAKTVQYVFLPILFPFFFLLYTDLLSLLLVLLALLASEKKNYALASLLAGLAVLTRQTNIVWFTFFFIAFCSDIGLLHSLFSLIPLKISKKITSALPSGETSQAHSIHQLLSTGIFCAGFMLFAAFMYINGGIAIGDKGSHPFPSFHLGNVYFLLFLLGILMLPMHLANIPKITRYLRTNPWGPALLVAFFVVGMLMFTNSHGYNQGIDSVFLRNRILSYFTLTPLLTALFFIPTTLAFLSLMVTRLHKPIYYLLYPFTILFLSPSWLIEQRYYFIPLVLLLLFRQEQGKSIEWLHAVFCIVLTSVLYWIVATRWLFL